MIQLDFLGAADGTPLTKSFRHVAGNSYDVTPYPMLRLFDSFRVEVKDIEEMHAALLVHAQQKRCLVKGTLRERLISAARQGQTDASEPTRWLCLDLDFDDGWDSIDDFLVSLDPALEDVSYIFQHSASAGIKARQGLRGHVFIMLDHAKAPGVLKAWLRHLNLTNPTLADRLRLTATGLGLRYPLDITTCQNDKLLYIAPPVCENFEDPIKDRFTLVRKGSDFAPELNSMFNLVPAVIDAATAAAVDALRERADLPKVKVKLREKRGVEFLVNPDKATVSDVRRARGFVYLNLNNGDSWGYYFPEDNPEYVYNFKGEPNVRLRDIAPDFYFQVKEQLREDARNARDFVPVAFRDRQRDCYYNGLYYPKTNTADITKASSKQKLQDFMAQYDEAIPEIIDDWTVEFNPTTFDMIDVDRKWVNTWQPTKYFLDENAGNGTKSREVPETINRVLMSICGNDIAVREHFLNWLAYIVQTRQKTGTAWVFHGVSGTGKGQFFERVLTPLFGPQHALGYTIQQLEDQFNAGIEKALILWLDEFHYASSVQGGMVMNKLKNLITESKIAIRAMRQETYLPLNYTNLIIATNNTDPLRLAEHDRRFNVAPAQHTPIPMTLKDCERLTDEVPAFLGFLMAYKVDTTRVRTTLRNEARDNMIAAAQTSVESMFDAFRAGNLGYFCDFFSVKMPLQDTLLYSNYEQALLNWCRQAIANKVSFVELHELRAVYYYILGQPIAPGKLRRMLSIHRINYNPEAGGAAVVWEIDEKRLREVVAARTASAEKPHLKLVADEGPK